MFLTIFSLVAFFFFMFMAFQLGRILNGVMGLLLDLMVVTLAAAGIFPALLLSQAVNIWPFVFWYGAILGAYFIGNFKVEPTQDGKRKKLYYIWLGWSIVCTIILLLVLRSGAIPAVGVDPLAEYY